MTWDEVLRMDIRDVVNDVEWQTLRRSLVGQWKRNRELCVEKLTTYFYANPRDPMRLRRVRNYLTGSGFRSGQINGSDTDDLLQEVYVAINVLREKQ